MLYITGEKDTLSDVQNREESTIPDFLEKVRLQNPHLRLSNPTLSQSLPAYTPVYLVSDAPSRRMPTEDVMGELLKFPLESRKIIRELQEQNVDILSLLAMEDLFESLNENAGKFREAWSHPLIDTPWESWNKSVKNSSLLSLFGRSAGYTSGLIANSQYMRDLDRLSQIMYQRDLLNTELHLLLKNQAGVNRGEFTRLESQIRSLTAEIKQLLPKSLETRLARKMNRLYGGSFARHRSNAGSKKIGRTGKAEATHLDFLNKSGVESLKKLTDRLNQAKKFLKRAGYVMGLGAVAYDTYEAYRNKESMGRAVTAGLAGFGVGVGAGALTSYGTSLGVAAIGSIMAQAGASSLVLVSVPFVGYVVLVVGSVVAAGYASYYASKYAEKLYDDYVVDFYDTYGQKIVDKVKEGTTNLINDMKHLWEQGSDWLVEFYGIKKDSLLN